jgi:hypothetical protein
MNDELNDPVRKDAGELRELSIQGPIHCAFGTGLVWCRIKEYGIKIDRYESYFTDDSIGFCEDRQYKKSHEQYQKRKG